ncbi:MAG TPA: hypothetical protein VIH42_05975 [Thermoguttaceae bacterium]
MLKQIRAAGKYQAVETCAPIRGQAAFIHLPEAANSRIFVFRTKELFHSFAFQIMLNKTG